MIMLTFVHANVVTRS